MGTVFTHELWYAPTERSCPLHVYLPEGYDDSDERYPVMYFFDGHNLFFDEMATFGKSWGLRDFLDQWEKPLIVVGMECNHEGDLRLHEYCPYRAHAFGSDIDGLGDKPLRWIVDEVKPWADATLRTWPHRAATGIGGSSMGGLMSLYAAIRYNDVFSKAACVSPGLRFWGGFLRRDLRDVTRDGSLDPDTRIYLSWGEQESGRTRKGADPSSESPESRAEADFIRRLDAAGVDTYRYFQWGGSHNEASWEQQNGRYLDYLWRDIRW